MITNKKLMCFKNFFEDRINWKECFMSFLVVCIAILFYALVLKFAFFVYNKSLKAALLLASFAAFGFAFFNIRQNYFPHFLCYIFAICGVILLAFALNSLRSKK